MGRSPLRYPGGKTKKNVQEKILSRLPYSFNTYVEPFFGGGGIYFAIPPNYVKHRWINDINNGLFEFYKALIERPEEFISRCKEIKSMQPGEEEVLTRSTSKEDSKKYNKRLKEKFDELKYNTTCDQALRYFFINRTVWAGRVTYDPKMESRMYFSNPAGWNIVDTNRLEEASEWMKGTKISCGDYRNLLHQEYDDALIYLDPPYVVDTELSSKSKLYEYGFSKQDHIDFADEVKKCKHKVCISYDDHPDVRSLFLEKDGFFLHEAQWSYCGTSNNKKEIGKELIITNYEVDEKNNFMVAIRNQNQNLCH